METIFEENPLQNPIKGGWKLANDNWEEFNVAITSNSLLPKNEHEGLVYQKVQDQLNESYAMITNEIFYFVESPQNKTPIKRIDIIQFQDLPGVQIIGNKQVFEIFFPNQYEFDNWYELLVEYCVQLNLPKFYIKDRKLGKGNYAKVYLGKDVKTQELVAIKAMKKTRLRESHRNVSAIINEIEGQRCIRHPNICRLFGVFEDNKKVYMIMEYCAGGELFTRIIKRKKFPEDVAAKFARGMLESFIYLHEIAFVVHRDIKLENILMIGYENDHAFKLADFGLATKFVLREETLNTRCGSPGYVAPEILKNIPYGPKVDVFSLGIILYILLVGRQPFYGRNPQEVLMQNKQCKINFQAKYWQDISKEAMHFVVQLTEPDPKIRPTAREALSHKWFQKECPISEHLIPANEIATPIQGSIFPLTPGMTPSSKFIAREKVVRQLENKGEIQLTDLVESPLLPHMQSGTPVATPGSSRSQSPVAFQQRGFTNTQGSEENSPIQFKKKGQQEEVEEAQKSSLSKQVRAIVNDQKSAPRIIIDKDNSKRKVTNVNVFTKTSEEESKS